MKMKESICGTIVAFNDVGEVALANAEFSFNRGRFKQNNAYVLLYLSIKGA